MPYIYDVSHDGTAKFLTTHATPNTEKADMALRQATRNFSLNALRAAGRGAALTTLSGIVIMIRRWTTAGSGGTAATPAPRRRDQPAAATTATTSVDGAITAGTVSGAVQTSFGFGAAGPGGWVARDDSSKILVEAGGADELDAMSISGTASLNYALGAEIEE